MKQHPEDFVKQITEQARPLEKAYYLAEWEGRRSTSRPPAQVDLSCEFINKQRMINYYCPKLRLTRDTVEKLSFNELFI